ncbi:Folate receptor beta [Gryllus bimaculatus]|nr:Folate receptor beta [Gryllus bimaculatus]
MIWLFLISAIYPTFAQLSNDPNQLQNWCLDAKHHKSKPGPEDELHKQCVPWKERACCTANTTRHLHVANLYKFNYNHCSEHRNMSESCRRHFMQDECFYECSPNIGPWVVKVSMKIRNERFFEVPLCASDCNAWFDACKDDFTCSEKWTDLIVKDGHLTPCHNQNECKTFADVFKTSKNFCEKIWDHSWKYTEDTDPCMRIWFDGSKGNPNDRIAQYYIQTLLGNDAVSNKLFDWLTITVLYLVANVLI